MGCIYPFYQQGEAEIRSRGARVCVLPPRPAALRGTPCPPPAWYGPRVEEIEELARRWADARRVVVLTGAGLSTASGIPDFRSPGGRWSSYRPVPIQDFLASEDSREEYWRYKGETWQVIQRAEPNAAHRALVDFARAGSHALLVTQNVDGLHERSGFPANRLVNVHGTDSAVVCLDCGAREARDRAQSLWETGSAVPRCACGGPWKPATISFGQNLVADVLERVMREASGCDLFVAAGTSLVVGPINQMFDQAQAAGATTAILAASETPYDAHCSIRLSDPVEQVLPAAFSRSGLS
jgi:NAD-dependent deacetylase